MHKSPTQTIIEDGIKGGWNKQYPVVETPEGVFHSKKDVRDILINWNGRDDCQIIRIHEALLDPKFWEAVGVARGWGECKCPRGELGQEDCKYWMEPIKMMHKFIDALAQGLSIDEALKTLE